MDIKHYKLPDLFKDIGTEVNTNVEPLVGLTLVLKSGGSVLAPVRRFTRTAFQLEYLCCMAVEKITM